MSEVNSQDNVSREVLNDLPQVPEGSKEIHQPEDIAAAFFKKEKPRLKFLLNEMSAKQIRRFVMYVAAYPLTDSEEPQTDLEKRAAYVFNEMMMNKMVMQLSQEMAKVDAAMQEEANTNNQGEENNG